MGPGHALAVFILETRYTWAIFVARSSLKMGTRRVTRLDELYFVVRRKKKRISKCNTSRRVTRLCMKTGNRLSAENRDRVTKTPTVKRHFGPRPKTKQYSFAQANAFSFENAFFLTRFANRPH